MESSGHFDRGDDVIDASSLWGGIDHASLDKVNKIQPKQEEIPEVEHPSTEVEQAGTEGLFGGYEEPESELSETPIEAPVEPDEQDKYVEPTEQGVEVQTEPVGAPTEQAEVQVEQTEQAEEVPAKQEEDQVERYEPEPDQDGPETDQAKPKPDQTEPEQAVEESTPKRGLFRRLFKRPEQKVAVPKGPGQKLKLYILVEKYQPNFAEYLEDRGITAQTIRTDIEDIKIDLMTGGDSYRVVVMEQGTGKFTATNMRKEIQDLAGMCDGSTKRLTMFYMRDILKLDLSKRYLGKVASGIQWEVYESIESLVKYLTGTGEVYVCTEERVDDTKTAKMEYNEMLQLLPSGAFGAVEEPDESQKKLRLGRPREFNVSENTTATYESAENLPEAEYDLSEDWVPGFVMRGL